MEKKKELKFVKRYSCRNSRSCYGENNVDMKYHVGTMIEIPRAALTADEIAKKQSSSHLVLMI